MKQKKRTLVFSSIGIGTLAISALALGAFTDTSSEHDKNIVTQDKFQVTSPVMMDTAYAVEYIADIQAVQHIELRAKVQGYIEKMHVDEGQSVKKGDVLFSLSTQQYEAELLETTANLNNAAAEVKAAEVEYKNTKELVDKNIVSVTQLDMAQAKIDALKAKVEEAKAQQSKAQLDLSYAHVTAPFDGIIGRIPNKTGSLIEEGELLTTLSDNSSVYAYFNVSEKEYLDLMAAKDNTNGQTVALVLANQQTYPHPGKIETVDSRIDKETGNIAFRATFSNPDLLLKHGSTGKVSITKEIKDALIIPQVATMEAQDILYVYTLNADNIVNRKSIVPKLRLPHLYVLESGLSVSDRILYRGLQHVREGDKIETEFMPFMQGKSSGQLALNTP